MISTLLIVGQNLTSKLYYQEAGDDAVVVNDLAQFLENPANFIGEDYNEIFVIGGESVYNKVMNEDYETMLKTRNL